VNGETNVEGMQREIREPRIHIKLCRYPERFTVVLSKAGNVRLGFRFERPTSQHLQELRISEVLKEGALPEHNARQGSLGHWHFAVLPDMRLEAANGVKGDAWEMAEELKRCETVTLQIRRAESVLLTQQQVRARLNFLASFRNQQQQQRLQQQQAADMEQSGEDGAEQDGEAAASSPERVPSAGAARGLNALRGATAGIISDQLKSDSARGSDDAAGDRFAAAAMLMAADASGYSAEVRDGEEH